MRATTAIRQFLTRQGARFTLALTLLYPCFYPSVANGYTDTDRLFASVSYRDSASDNIEHDQRLQAARDYMKDQAPRLLSALSDNVRMPFQFMLNKAHQGQSLFSLDLSTDDEAAAPAPIPFAQRLAKSDDDPMSNVLATTYHHRHGVLPFHDALMFGAHSENYFATRYIHTDIHPYFGQNYFSLRHYYGADVKMDLAKGTDWHSAGRPWGSLTLGYTSGESKMMDQSRGFHANLSMNVSEQVSLTSGMHDGEGSSGTYVSLQWKMPFD